MASACVFLMNIEKDILDKSIDANLSHINVGTGKDCSIKELAEKISEIVGFQGRIDFDTSKPDGTRRKLLDVKKINNLGWNSSISLEEGLLKTYHWYKENIKSLRQK